jgi:outer membrane biosynthesis protein TonB
MPAIQQKEPINYKAAAYTAGIHALLFLLFILLHSSTPIPPPITNVEGGIEVNLGTSDEGSGHDQPMNTKAPAPYQATVVFKSAAVKSNLPKPIMQSDEKDAPEVNNSNKEKKNKPVTVTNEPEHKALPQQKPKYTYAGETGQGGNSAAQNKPGTGEGNDNGHGDKGVPGGTPGAPNYTGSPGNGNGGIGHNLSGRQIYPDHFEAEFNESGKVVIHVTVDRNGNIINKYVKTSSSSQLNKIALEEINSVKFSKSNSPEPQQFGDVTIIFKTRH